MATNHGSMTAAKAVRVSTEELPGEAARLGEASESAESSGDVKGNRQEAIYQTVIRLLGETQVSEERRWVPRVPYVRPAWVYLKQARYSKANTDRGILVATTDISFEGIGILSWEEILVSRLLLQVSDVCFACQVRWSEALGHQMYRYGLHCCDVVTRH